MAIHGRKAVQLLQVPNPLPVMFTRIFARAVFLYSHNSRIHFLISGAWTSWFIIIDDGKSWSININEPSSSSSSWWRWWFTIIFHDLSMIFINHLFFLFLQRCLLLIFFGRQDLKRARWLPPFNDKVVKEAINALNGRKEQETYGEIWGFP